MARSAGREGPELAAVKGTTAGLVTVRQPLRAAVAGRARSAAPAVQQMPETVVMDRLRQ